VSLHPLSFDEAMRVLLQVKPAKGPQENIEANDPTADPE
jgi:hypothetical protein